MRLRHQYNRHNIKCFVGHPVICCSRCITIPWRQSTGNIHIHYNIMIEEARCANSGSDKVRLLSDPNNPFCHKPLFSSEDTKVHEL